MALVISEFRPDPADKQDGPETAGGVGDIDAGGVVVVAESEAHEDRLNPDDAGAGKGGGAGSDGENQ